MFNAWVYLIIYTKSWLITGEGVGYYESVKDLCYSEFKSKSSLIGFKVLKNINWLPITCFQSRDCALRLDATRLYINFIYANDAIYVLKNTSAP